MLTSGHSSQNLECGITPVIHVDKPADHGEQQDHEDGSQSRDEEDELLTVRELLGKYVARCANAIEHEQCTQAHSRISLGRWEILECIDNDTISGIASGPWTWEGFAQQCGNLTNKNVES